MCVVLFGMRLVLQLTPAGVSVNNLKHTQGQHNQNIPHVCCTCNMVYSGTFTTLGTLALAYSHMRMGCLTRSFILDFNVFKIVGREIRVSNYSCFQIRASNQSPGLELWL